MSATPPQSYDDSLRAVVGATCVVLRSAAMTDLQATIAAGASFQGRWIVERPLSSGGMGAVYVAKHADTGRSVALKVIKSPEAANNNELVSRFRKETAALAAISHPNVVTFLD